jgi:hypothetical protein
MIQSLRQTLNFEIGFLLNKSSSLSFVLFSSNLEWNLVTESSVTSLKNYIILSEIPDN